MSERNCDKTIDKWPAEKKTGIDLKSVKASSISQSTTENSIREQFTLKPACKFEKEKTKIINYLDVDVGKIPNDDLDKEYTSFKDVQVTDKQSANFCQEVFRNSPSTPDIFVTTDLDVDDISATSEPIGQNEANSLDIRNYHRSLTLELESNLKTNSVIPNSSVWDNNNGRKRLIRQSTVEGIKNYFDTLDRMEQNSMSFVAKNRRYSLPLPPSISSENDCAKNTQNKTVMFNN